MDDEDVVLGAEVDDLLEQLGRRGLARRHVGIVDEHHLHALDTGAFDRLEIGVEVRLLIQRVGEHHAARKPHGSRIGRISGVGNQYLVAGVEECHADVHQALLRAQQRQNFGVVVQFGAVPLGIPVGESLAQDGFALVGHVFVYVGTMGFGRESFDDRCGGRQVGAAHGEFDDLTTRGRFDLGDFAQTARKIVLSDAVQPMRTGDVDCFCHNYRVVDEFAAQQR